MKETVFGLPSVFPVESFVTYIIQPGDTLLSIMEKYRSTCQELAILNPETALFKIVAGRTLRIPDR